MNLFTLNALNLWQITTFYNLKVFYWWAMKILFILTLLVFISSSCTESGESSIKKKGSTSTSSPSGSNDSGSSGSGDSGSSGSGDSGSSGSGSSDTPTYTVSINGPNQVEIDQCSTAFTITLYESAQEFVATSDTNVDLNGNGNGNFYEANDCSGATITSTTILTGSSSTAIYFKNSSATDTHLLNVAATDFDSGLAKSVQITAASATQFTMTVPSDKSADTPTTIELKAVDGNN